MKIKSTRSTLVIIAAITAFTVFTGCSKNSPVEPTDTTSYNEDADVAESIAGTLGEDTGGMLDQVNDMIMLAGDESLGKTDGDFFDTKEKTWNENTQSWTIILVRERGNQAGVAYAYIAREYNVQFLNRDNVPQRFYITNGDTANTMHFKITSGSGRHKTLKLSQELLDLQGSFIATGIQTDTVTVNGSYYQSAVDTIRNNNFTRIHSHTTSLTASNLKGQRLVRNRLVNSYSGVITGAHNAEIHWQGDKGEGEKTISKEINVEIENGTAVINLNNYKYKSNLTTGQVN